MFLLPVNRDRRPTRTSIVTNILIAANSLVWLAFTIAGTNQIVIQHYGLVPGNWTIPTLFTHMFLHAGFWHIAGNMYFFWMFAPKLEEKLGSLFFALAYLICGLGAASLQTLLTPGSMIPMVGASGAISGVAGMYFVLFPRSPFTLELYLGWWHVKSFNAMTRGAVGAWLGEQFILGLITSFARSVGIAFWAHVGGFVAGFSIAALVATKASKREQDEILHPAPLTEIEKEKLEADYEEQPSDLTSLKLNGQTLETPKTSS